MASGGTVNMALKYGAVAFAGYLGYEWALKQPAESFQNQVALQIQKMFFPQGGGYGDGGSGACSITVAQLAASMGVSVARVKAAMAKHSRATPCDVKLSDFDDTPDSGGGGGGGNGGGNSGGGGNGGGGKSCPFIPGNRYVAQSATGFQLVWRGRLIEDGVGQTKAENDYNELCQNDYY